MQDFLPDSLAFGTWPLLTVSDLVSVWMLSRCIIQLLQIFAGMKSKCA